ncbi:Putative D-glutamate cyclase, hydro-lyase [Septoria linicola]|uniref:D-glutamate cyclase, hydro-lyase n=1 Tax=Septoria linicola TaxID=215465 RepID=A0A9Q9AYG8_9PEZI|nr:Putative D-glutamate cyclase, hydro-lyase [Septoria linicola]
MAQDLCLQVSVDIRRLLCRAELDASRYNVYVDGKLQEPNIPNVESFWRNDHLAFLIGCSYSFESALTKAGLTPPHGIHGRNVTMYRSNIPFCPAGVFTQSTFVVSMRMYRSSQVERVRDITRPYVATHGEPVAWGWSGADSIGVHDVNAIHWGDTPVTAEGDAVNREAEEAKQDAYVPVFWGCGVTPQEAVMRAHIPGITIGHAPGSMILLDVKEDDVLG